MCVCVCVCVCVSVHPFLVYLPHCVMGRSVIAVVPAGHTHFYFLSLALEYNFCLFVYCFKLTDFI